MAKTNREKATLPGDNELIARKDWHILSGNWDRVTGKQEFDFRIKSGDDVSKLPEWALDALKTEKVI